MPHLPDHQTSHDPLLIAAFASGDAEGADLERARDLVATCDECAALHHDLRSIGAAMPALPVPARTRDFRFTPEQAASLRPAGWRRLLAPLAGPRFAFAAPLGGSLAALGIAGILVAGAAGSPISGQAARDGAGAAAASPDLTTVRLDGEQGSASAAPVDEHAYQAAASQAAPAAGGVSVEEGPRASQPGDTSAAAPAPVRPAPQTADGQIGAGPVQDPGPETALVETVRASTTTVDVLASPLTTLAFVLLAAGVVLVIARWFARRLA